MIRVKLVAVVSPLLHISPVSVQCRTVCLHHHHWLLWLCWPAKYTDRTHCDTTLAYIQIHIRLNVSVRRIHPQPAEMFCCELQCFTFYDETTRSKITMQFTIIKNNTNHFRLLGSTLARCAPPQTHSHMWLLHRHTHKHTIEIMYIRLSSDHFFSCLLWFRGRRATTSEQQATNANGIGNIRKSRDPLHACLLIIIMTICIKQIMHAHL